MGRVEKNQKDLRAPKQPTAITASLHHWNQTETIRRLMYSGYTGYIARLESLDSGHSAGEWNGAGAEDSDGRCCAGRTGDGVPVFWDAALAALAAWVDTLSPMNWHRGQGACKSSRIPSSRSLKRSTTKASMSRNAPPLRAHPIFAGSGC